MFSHKKEYDFRYLNDTGIISPWTYQVPVAPGQQQNWSFCSIKPHNFPSYLLQHVVYRLIQKTFTNIRKTNKILQKVQSKNEKINFMLVIKGSENAALRAECLCQEFFSDKKFSFNGWFFLIWLNAEILEIEAIKNIWSFNMFWNAENIKNLLSSLEQKE